MADITTRDAGRAGTVYDVGGKTYYTEREAQRAAAAIDNMQAQQQSQTTSSADAGAVDKVTITQFADGKVGILFPGGGIQLSNSTDTDKVTKALQDAYGDRVSNIIQSSVTSDQAAEQQKSIRQDYRNKAVDFADRGSGYYAGSENEMGVSEEDIQKYIDSSANKQGPGYTSVDEFVQDSLNKADRLASPYFGDAWDTMTDKQKLAAHELYYQGNGDTGRTNGLSAKDVDWVLNKANDFKGIVTSPNAQAISTGFDKVIGQKAQPVAPTTTTTKVNRLPPKEQKPAGMTQAGVPITEVPVTPTTYGTQQTGGTTTYQNGIATTTTTPSVGYTASGTYPQSATTGTFNLPLQSSGLSAVPTSVTVASQPGGYTQEQLTRTTPGMGGMAVGVRTVKYTNAFGQSIPVTESNGTPITYVPPGYTRGDGSTAQQGMQVATPAGTMTAGSSTGTRGPGVLGGGRGTGSTPYSGPMSGGPMSENPNAPRPSLSQLSSNQELVIGPDGWYVRDAQDNNIATHIPGTLFGYAEGGQSEDKMLEAKYRIASMNGYQGPKTNAALNAFANSSPAMTAKFNAIGAALAKGGYMRKGYDKGGLSTTLEDFQGMQQNLVTQTMQPMQAPVAMIQPTEQDFIPATAGQVAPIAPFAEAATAPTTAQAGMPVLTPASVMQAATTAPQVQAATDQMQAAQGQIQPQAQVQAAQQADTSVAGMQAAQGTAIMMDNPVQRQIQQGELVSGAANAQTAAAFTEQVQAATATPSKQATVAGQLEGLMQQFEGGNTPPWAAASMRNATAILAARGLGASSMAGQAVIQAAMEAALPIAQMDAQVQAQFESQNLTNRQQRAMMAAQQRAEFLGMEFTQEFQARVQNSARIGDIANMNFTAEQQIALENSRAANTVNLNNLNNRQAMVMAEAAALSQLDMQNLSNRQQAAVQNAQNFLQMDLTNLSNEQQATMFKAQSVIQSLFTDQAAENAAKQFNASSENQTNQFFASLASNTSQFNAVQQNAMDQFNVDAVNTLRQFNSEIQQQRDMFNAQNGLVIAQANAQWRQNIATLNTATQNQSNMDFAKTINALTSTNLDQIWQRERDILSMAYQSAESNADRALSITLQKMAADATIEAAKFQADVQADIAKGQGWADVFSTVIGLI